MKGEPKTIGFQLDAAHHKRLSEIAKRYKMSAGQYAREVVIRSLDSNEEGLLDALNLLAEKLDENQNTVSNLRKDLSHDLAGVVQLLQQIQNQKR
jgi:signal transduction histidine kinase